MTKDTRFAVRMEREMLEEVKNRLGPEESIAMFIRNAIREELERRKEEEKKK